MLPEEKTAMMLTKEQVHQDDDDRGGDYDKLDKNKVHMKDRIHELEALLDQSHEENAQLKEEVGTKELLMTALLDKLEDEIASRTKELQETNRLLVDANQRIKQQAAAQLEHFACMSHEIRTPLNCIIGMSSLLMLDSQLTPSQQESIEMITTAGDLLSTIVDDVLDYSTLESGKVETNISKINLQQTLDSVATGIQARCNENERGIEVRTFFDITVPKYVETDAKRLQQILYNLLGNAVKFSPNNSHVDLSAKVIDSGVIRYTVKDYGRGIDPRDFNKIFEPFRQASKETGTIYGGTGLGLPITSKLVQRLGGTISVKSVKGQGSEFLVDLPFLGNPVDVGAIQQSLADTSILVVSPTPGIDCPVLESLRATGIPFHIVPDCSAIKQFALDMTPKEKELYYVTFVNEDYYKHSPYQVFYNTTKSVMITFGPKNIVKGAHAHIKAPSRVFPSILLPSCAELVQALKASPNRMQLPDGPSSQEMMGKDLPHSCIDEDEDLDTSFYNTLQILIAEDNIVNQKVLQRTFSRLGLNNVDVAQDGLIACEASLQKKYDVIFMDMEMPNMNGIDACRAIRERDGNDAPLVVFVTAHAMENFRQEAKKAGGTGFISKPFNLHRIKAFLKRLCWCVKEEDANTKPPKEEAGSACIMCDPQSE